MNKQSVIEYFAKGGDAADGIRDLAHALGITREAIYQWPERVPELRAFQIERLTDGALRVEEPAA